MPAAMNDRRFVLCLGAPFSVQCGERMATEKRRGWLVLIDRAVDLEHGAGRCRCLAVSQMIEQVIWARAPSNASTRRANARRVRRHL